jgi:hypothetical protein
MIWIPRTFVAIFSICTRGVDVLEESLDHTLYRLTIQFKTAFEMCFELRFSRPGQMAFTKPIVQRYHAIPIDAHTPPELLYVVREHLEFES